MMKSSSVATILIVNDNAPLAVVLREGLKWILNCQVLTALSGQDALQIFKETAIDVLITDTHISDIDGLALAGQVRQLYPATAIVLVSRNPDANLEEQASNLDIRHVLTKPVGLVQLRKAILELLGERVTTVGLECSAN